MNTSNSTGNSDLWSKTSDQDANTDDEYISKIGNASIQELRGITIQISRELREARISAAQSKHKYNLLAINSSETANRMAVELTMIEREVEVLKDCLKYREGFYDHKGNLSRTRDHDQQYTLLKQENEQLYQMLLNTIHTNRSLQLDNMNLREERKRLRGRIKKNRDHVNHMIRSLSRHDHPCTATARTRGAAAARSRDLSPARTASSRDRDRDPNYRQIFDTLLLADRVLNQESTFHAYQRRSMPGIATSSAHQSPFRQFSFPCYDDHHVMISLGRSNKKHGRSS